MEMFTWVLLAVALVFIGIIGFMGYRLRILMKMGLRNVTRRKVNSLIVVVGLMIGTTIISGSLVIGDTLENMYTKSVYDSYDETDEIIFSYDPGGSLAFIDYTEYRELNDYIARDENGIADKVSDVSPEIYFRVGVLDEETKLSENNAAIIGFDYSESKGFGKLESLNVPDVTGEELAENEVYVNEELAEELDIEEGHTLQIIIGEEKTAVFTVRDIVKDSGRAAYAQTGDDGFNILMPLRTAQVLLNHTDKINILKITNVGDERSGMQYSDDVAEALTPYLNSRNPFLLISKAKQDDVESAEDSSEGFQDMFLMFGSFSIIAGIMLIINIFVMLAEERKSEMGISRAIGLKRKQLMSMFLFEGTAYSILSAAVGTVMGMLVAYLVIVGFGSIGSGGSGRFGESSGPLEFFTFTLDSLVIAFAGGMLITLITIIVASRKVSRLNIIRAIRNIPEPRYLRYGVTKLDTSQSWGLRLRTLVHDTIMRQYELIIMAAGAFLVFCAFVDIGLLYNVKWAGTSGLSGFIYGIGLLLRRYMKDEKAFTIAGGIVLIQWSYPYDFYDQLFGIQMEGDMEIIIISGLFMVSSALMVIMYNSNLILGGLMRIFGRFKSLTPVFKTAISYPMDNRFRTGMTLAMFALILFTITILAMVMGLFGGNIDQMVKDNSGGYDMIAYTGPDAPIEDMELRIEEIENLSSDDFSTIVPMNTAYLMMYPIPQDEGSPEQRAQEQLDMPMGEFQEQGDAVWYDLLGCTDEFFEESDFELEEWDRDEYDDYEDVWKAIQADCSLVILDRNRMIEPGEEEEENHGPMRGEGIFRVNTGDSLVLRDIKGNARVVTVVGFTKTLLIQGIFIRSDVVTGEDAFNSKATAMTLIKFSEDTSESRQKEISKDLEQEFLGNGMKTVLIREELEGFLSTMTSFMSLMQAFLGLGLLVGIAGLGIITIRSVAERKQQIGVLRAIGFRRGMIVKSFLIESSYIALLGILTGVGLGIILSLKFYFDDTVGPAFEGDFIIPWSTLILVSLISYCLSFLSTIGPARGAARVAPAEALRYRG